MEPGTEPITDEELLYRRIPESMHLYSASTGLDPAAFAPHKTNDVTGLSVYRAKYTSIEEAARGRPGKSYLVAVLNAGNLRKNGIEVVARPLPGEPGHAELPELNSADRKSDRTLKLQQLLASKLCLEIKSPFRHSDT